MSQSSVLRIIDASLNRATEGLRVAEDYVRFVLDDPFLTAELKKLRHELAAAAGVVPSAERHAARETQRDVGTAISTQEEVRRSDARSVCAASLKRAEQSLRSLEEYGKLVDAAISRRMESLRYRLYTLEKAIDVGRANRARLEGVRLCVLVDGRESVSEFERLVVNLVEAGVCMIQLRDKVLDDRELIERARTLISLTRRQPPAQPGAVGGTRRCTLAVVNDRADIAAAVQADGVHLGQDDLSVKDARAVIGPRMLVGVSTHNIDQARAAVLDGADYLGAGPTFPSRTKNFDEFAGLDYLRKVSAEIRLPTFAIGGIGLGNVTDVLSAGCSRVAIGAAVVGTDDPARAAREFANALRSCTVARHPHPGPLPEGEEVLQAAAVAAAPSLNSER